MNTPVWFYCDEVWRGPLAWPVTVCVTLPVSVPDTQQYIDSKQLTAQKRAILFQQCNILTQKKQLYYGIWTQSAQQIDNHWIIKALQTATLHAVFKVVRSFLLWAWYALPNELPTRPSIKATNTLLAMLQKITSCSWLLIDWNHTFGVDKLLTLPVDTLIKWDQRNHYIAMASIIAKETRDAYMIKQAKRYPHYWFETNKWYGTATHRAAIKIHWLSKLHRQSFCRGIVG